jgi:hypothetical protein
LQAFVLTDLQIERAISEREATIHTLSATDTKVGVDDILEIGKFHFPTGKGISRTHLIFRSRVPCEKLRIEKTGTEIAVTAHCVSVKTLDCRNQFVAPVCTNTAPDTFIGVNLPNERITGNFLLTGKQTGGTG